MKFFRKLSGQPSRDGEKTAAENAGLRLIVGLGNPGKEYQGARHNVGFEVVDRIAREESLDWERDRKSKALTARRGTGLILVKPQTYMNLSGRAVAKLTRFYKISTEETLVVYDDVDTPLGKIRFKPKGSAGGHNGIKSLIQCLGTEEFARLKIGIGASKGKERMVGHVLGKFRKDELPVIEDVYEQAVAAVHCALNEGLATAMNQFNRRHD